MLFAVAGAREEDAEIHQVVMAAAHHFFISVVAFGFNIRTVGRVKSSIVKPRTYLGQQCDPPLIVLLAAAGAREEDAEIPQVVMTAAHHFFISVVAFGFNIRAVGRIIRNSMKPRTYLVQQCGPPTHCAACCCRST